MMERTAILSRNTQKIPAARLWESLRKLYPIYINFIASKQRSTETVSGVTVLETLVVAVWPT